MSGAARPAPALDVLRSPETIRERCGNILTAALAGDSPHFRVDRERLDAAAAAVERETRARYPDLRIPYHSRWRHFEAGGIDRRAVLEAALAGRDAAACARARIDLAVVSVLLDAGAGAAWSYREADSGLRLSRSEGLGVASLHAFMSGAFSSDPGDPLRVDARALSRIDAAAVAAIFQSVEGNPLVGIEGRAELLRRLGTVMAADAQRFGGDGRPGALFDRLVARLQPGEALPAAWILRELLDGFSAIWPSGNRIGDEPIGDAWPHPRAGGSGPGAGWVPFHKLSQWLAYSLLEPFTWAGVRVAGLDALTALPEYRNGGLLLDTGVLRPRDETLPRRTLRVGDEVVVEWRALTVALVDALAPMVRERLLPAATPEARREALPLACILEGGTWQAGRALAASLRGGEPPLRIESDGTIF